MNIIFKRLTLHNFGSYSHAEIDLSEKGFCLVTGINNYSQDNAISNGSGKSLLWDAIIYALTGVTGRGVSTGLKNIHCTDTDEMYVELEFILNQDNFVVRRGEK